MGSDRRGSVAADRQMVRAAEESRLVSACFSKDVEVTGWVVSMDDYSWVMITTDQEVHIVHKSCPVLKIGARVEVPVGSKAANMRSAFLKWADRHFGRSAESV